MASKKTLKCILTPPVAEERLLAFLDGVPDPDLAIHLRACQRCSTELRAYAETENLLAVLERYDCPTPVELADYAAGRASGGRRRVIEQHVVQCLDCQAELATARSFLDVVPQPGLSERLARGIEQVVDALRLRPVTTLAPASAVAYRDAGEQLPQSFEADGVRVELSVAQIERGTRTLRGRVRGPSPLPSEWVGAKVTLSETGQAQAPASTETSVDARGVFRFDAVAPGTYDVTITVLPRPLLLEAVVVG